MRRICRHRQAQGRGPGGAPANWRRNVAPQWPPVSSGALGAAWRSLRGRRRLLLALGACGGVLARLLLP